MFSSNFDCVQQDSFMTILLMCGMFSLPTTKLASILAVDWLLDRLDGICKVFLHKSKLSLFIDETSGTGDISGPN